MARTGQALLCDTGSKGLTPKRKERKRPGAPTAPASPRAQRLWLASNRIASVRPRNALENGKRALELDPDMLNAYGQIAVAYCGLNRIEESRSTLNSAIQRKGNTSNYHSFLASIDWADGKEEDMEKELQTASTTPDGALSVLGFRLNLATVRGQLSLARETMRGLCRWRS